MSWGLWKVEDRRAAKPYKCEEESCAIAVGDMHVRYAGVFEGMFIAHRVCSRCAAMRNLAWKVFEFDSDEGPPVGDLRDYLKLEEGVEDLDEWFDVASALAKGAA